MTNDPTGQAISKSLKETPEQLKEIQNSISSIKVSAIKPQTRCGKADDKSMNKKT
jgi:hypothetical protein